MTQVGWFLLIFVLIALGLLEHSINATRKQFKALRRDLTRDAKRLRRRLKQIEQTVLRIERNVQRIERRTRHPMGPAVTRPEDLQVGDLLIHSQHGLGRYVGMSRHVEDGVELDYLDLEFAEGIKLHHPVIRLDMICRYGGDPRSAVLDTLGG